MYNGDKKKNRMIQNNENKDGMNQRRGERGGKRNPPSTTQQNKGNVAEHMGGLNHREG